MVEILEQQQRLLVESTHHAERLVFLRFNFLKLLVKSRRERFGCCLDVNSFLFQIGLELDALSRHQPVAIDGQAGVRAAG
jgi:hypothetical protein